MKSQGCLENHHQKMKMIILAIVGAIRDIAIGLMVVMIQVLFDFLVTVKVAPHECVIRTGLP